MNIDTLSWENLFIEMFCSVRTALVNPSGSGGRRDLVVLEQGDLEGNFR